MMEKRIDLERRGKDPSEITELTLDNSRATQIEGLTDEYVHLESLSLISVGLTTLKGFPQLPKLRKLELSENRICSGLAALNGCPNITHLNLSYNKIKDLETLEPLKYFKCMTHLDLFSNDVCKIEDYRTKVFELIKSLKFLDGYDVEENEAEESDSESYDGVNGVNEEDDDDDGEDGEEDEEEEAEEEEDEDEDEDGPGLAAIYNLTPAMYNDQEDGDYKCSDEDDDEEVEEEEEEEETSEEPKVKRRKLEDEEEGDGGGGQNSTV